jgi:energy-coupling factor transport system substrate-specific component
VNWQIASFLVLVAVLAAGFAWYERSRPPAKVLSLVAALAALATVGRIAFAPIPNVKPTTDIALFAGYALGPVPGFAVGAVAALASNVFFGQGPWTPWQMVGWGGAGLLGGLLARLAGRDLGRWRLAAACALAGALFGMLLDAYQWVQGAEQDLPHYLAVAATSAPYNAAHVVGNIGFCLLLGPTFVRALMRYRRRFEVRWAPAAAALLAALAVGGALVAPTGAAAASPSARAVAYLQAAQNGDGGFGGGRGQSSTQLHTGWAALGLAAAGRNPADVSSGGVSIVDYLRAHAAGLSDIGDLERTALALDAAGVSPRSFAGRDLVAAIQRRRSSNGSWSRNNGWTAFGVLALKAVGAPGVRGSVRWLARQQNRDGGFGFRPSAVSDVDDTGAVLQALAAGGMRGSKVARRAVRFLKGAQRPDGGFGQMRFQDSNAQSSSWAVQGLVAAGRNPGAFKRRGRSPLAYLRSLQNADGSVRYSRTSSQTPVWVTAQALDAFERKAFPLAPAPRQARAEKPKARSGGGSGGGPAAGTGHKPGAARGKVKPKPRATAPDAPPPAGSTEPAAPAATSEAPSSTDRAPAPAAAAERAVARMRSGSGGGSEGAWVGGALVAGVAALALWRIARRRRPSPG